MRFGAFIAPYHRPDGRPGAALHRDLALVEDLEDLGYDEAWFGEHHSGGWEIIGSPELMVASAAARTSRIRLGTGVISLPYHHPFTAAERVVQLDHLTGGRLLVGVGSGALDPDARMLGLDPSQRHADFREALEAFCALLRRDGPVTRAGRHFRLEEAHLHLPFAGPAAPPLYLASSFAGAGLAHAAERDAGLLLLGVGTEAAPRFRAALAKADSGGRRLDRRRLLLVLNLHVGETRRDALDAIRAGAEAEQYEYWTGTIGMPAPDYPRAEHVERLIARGQLIAGSPGDCIDGLRDLLEMTGPVGGILLAAREWADPASRRAHWELFARDVAPALRELGERMPGRFLEPA